MPTTIHLIANAHLDPVWLWDWREGLNEGIITVRAILDMMDANPELTFIRGEAAVYQHIEQHDPETFDRVRRYVEAGRWDVVGGTHIQPDTNLPATETFARHFARAQSYFQSQFGKRARVAWAADSFGHSAGLPEILAAAGMQGYAFSLPGESVLSLEKPAFWWEGPGGSRVMGYRISVGWYGSERHELLGKLDRVLEHAQQTGLENVGCFYGVGNHGGGPTLRHLAEIREWTARHPEVTVIHSGLHRLFDALYEEVARRGETLLPTHRGELNFCLRGCYASAARFKFLYRRTEALLSRAERTDTVIGAALDRTPTDLPPGPAPTCPPAPSLKGRGESSTKPLPLPGEPASGLGKGGGGLGTAWDAVLFNSFHDILPGSSIERAYDDQFAWIGGVIHQAQQVELAALNALARQIDTRVAAPEGDHPSPIAFLVWNPHPHPYRGHIELEGGLDYRPIWSYANKPDELPVEVRGPDGQPQPFQLVAPENLFGNETFPWRKRAVVPVELPAFGWNVLTMGWVEGAETAAAEGPLAEAPEPGVIANGLYTVRAEAGSRSIQMERNGRSIFGKDGLSAVTVEDPWGSWGGMGEEPESLDLSTVRHDWTVAQVETLETGPERAALWVRLTGGNSRLDLTFLLYRGRDAVDVQARVFWNERAARLKLVFPAGDAAEFEVPGGSARRGPSGEVPGGRWARVEGANGAFGFASDALYSFAGKDGAFRATVVRATRYSADRRAPAEEAPWQPAVDVGELRFRFLLTRDTANLPTRARELEEPPVALLVPAGEGPLPRAGSLATLAPDTLRILALKPAEDGNGLILRVQETAGVETEPQFVWLGELLPLSRVPAYRIVTWRLTPAADGWQAEATTIQEN